MLKVSPNKKNIVIFGIRGKLNPRYVGPFKMLDTIGEVAYRIALPPTLAGIHNIFHISMLRKHVLDPNHIVKYEPSQLSKGLT